jgi:hypothetical protein
MSEESRNVSDLHPVAVGQRLIRGQAKQPTTHDQCTVLVIDRLLLSELHTASTEHLVNDWRIRTNLVFDDGIPEIFREFAHRVSVCVVFLVANCAGAPGYGLQLVLDPLESSRMGLTPTSFTIDECNSLKQDCSSSVFAFIVGSTLRLQF